MVVTSAFRERTSAVKSSLSPSADQQSEAGECSQSVSARSAARVSPVCRSRTMMPTASASRAAPAIVSQASLVPSGEKVGSVSYLPY